MRSLNQKLGAVIFCAALACAGVVAANAQTARPTPDSLRGLKRALETAGAPALSTQQEEQLKALIQQFRESRKSQEPDAALGAARKAYHEAILAGDAAAANAQAQTIANLVATDSSESLKAESSLAIQALAIIKSNSQQFDALVQKFGNSGVSRLMSSLPRAGRIGRGPGMGPSQRHGDKPGERLTRPNRFEGSLRSRRR
jgi:hypothetical protein